MSLEQEKVLIEFHRDTVVEVLITDTIQFMGFTPDRREGFIDGNLVDERGGIIVETPYLQIEFWEGNQLACRVLENDATMDSMLVEIIGVPEYNEHGFLDQLAYVPKVDLKIVSMIPD